MEVHSLRTWRTLTPSAVFSFTGQSKLHFTLSEHTEHLRTLFIYLFMYVFMYLFIFLQRRRPVLSFARRHCFAEILRGFKKPYVFRQVEAPGIKIKVQINKIKAYIVIFYRLLKAPYSFSFFTGFF